MPCVTGKIRLLPSGFFKSMSSASHRNTLSAEERLKSRKVLDALMVSGKVLRSDPFLIHYLAVPYLESSPAQIAFSVPKRRMKLAVDRNRMKRRMREAYRKNKHDLLQWCRQKETGMVLLLVYRHGSESDHLLTQEKIVLLLKRLVQTHEKTDQ